jgi:hypothetical protein
MQLGLPRIVDPRLSPMRSVIVLGCAALLGLLPSSNGFAAPTGTAFTYQGVLSIAGAPATGPFDFQFSLFDSAAAGAQVGSTLSQSGVAVSNGLFTVQLDFASAAFKGDARWLEISVRATGAAVGFTILSPRQAVTATPYALTALSAWNQTGNVGTSPSSSFIGTTDNSALVLRTNNVEALRVLAGQGSTGGNVGIGTSTPTFPLDVAGDVNTTSQYDLAGTPILQAPGTQNTFVGPLAGSAKTGGADNTASGYAALFSITSGSQNTATGAFALQSDSTGCCNTAAGYGALGANSTGIDNAAVGQAALRSNTTGSFNAAIGFGALASNTIANANAADGTNALHANTTGSSNTASGNNALLLNTSGSSNTAVGYQAGAPGAGSTSNTTGSQNTFIGYNAGPGTATQIDNATAIGANAAVSQSNALVLGGAGPNGVNVGIGTQTPQSTLQVAGNTSSYGSYLQIPIVNSAASPPATDCNTTTFGGRMVLQDNAGTITLWVCSASKGTWVAK